MINTQIMLIKRAIWYIVGLLLFYAPFALYQKALFGLVNYNKPADIHSLCLRMPLLNLLLGKWSLIVPVVMITLFLFFMFAIIFGPFFCGRLCFAGALPEYLSRLIPDRFKIDWVTGINPIPVRYGFLAGYLITPFLAGSIACAFCNLSFMQRLIDGGFWGEFGVLSSTNIITFFLWIILFGIFTKGGRGFCNFICPIGAVQSLVYSISSRLHFTYKLRFAKDKCISCGACVKACSMGSLQKEPDNSITYQIHNCITCLQCQAACPKNALTYGTGKSGWKDGITLVNNEPSIQESIR